MKKVFLFLIPSIFILIYAIAALFPTLSIKLGGISNISNFLIVFLTYFYVVLTGLLVQQMIKNEEYERRPYIIADFEFVNHEVWIAIKNIGKMPAKKLYVSITPEIVTIANKKLSETIFSSPWSFFPPDKVFRSFINSSVEFLKDERPMNYSINLKYTWDGQKESVDENYEVNIENHKHLYFVGKKDIHDIHKILDKLNDNIKNISKSLVEFLDINKS